MSESQRIHALYIFLVSFLTALLTSVVLHLLSVVAKEDVPAVFWTILLVQLFVAFVIVPLLKQLAQRSAKHRRS